MGGPRVGVDIVLVSRVEKMLEARKEALVARLLTPQEAAYCLGPKEAQRVSGRIAAKEAVMKVLGDGWPSIPWTSIEILPDVLGRPKVTLTGKAQQRFTDLGLVALDLSISHDGGFAVAVAVAVDAAVDAVPDAVRNVGTVVDAVVTVVDAVVTVEGRDDHVARKCQGDEGP